MKTIYVLSVARYGQPVASVAYECQQCANIQADWHKREKCAATVTAVTLHAHMRGAIVAHDSAIARTPAKLNGVELAHDHVPDLIGNLK